MAVLIVESGSLLATADSQPSDEQAAKDKAARARLLSEFLDLLTEMASGKKRETGEPFEYIDVVITVPAHDDNQNTT